MQMLKLNEFFFTWIKEFFFFNVRLKEKEREIMEKDESRERGSGYSVVGENKENFIRRDEREKKRKRKREMKKKEKKGEVL